MIDCKSTEEELIELARQGDRDAFGELIKPHHLTYLKRASSLLGNPDDAEDEVQTPTGRRGSVSRSIERS
jgi:hypothetical protein